MPFNLNRVHPKSMMSLMPLGVMLSLSLVAPSAWGVETFKAIDLEATSILPPPIENPSYLLRLLQSYFVPPKQGAPKSTANSATRNARSCGPQEAAIEAIAPPGGYGLTLRDRPQIILSLPPTSAQRVALLFRNETGAFFESALLPIPQSSRSNLFSSPELQWVSFQLPNSSQPLPSGRYRWSLVVVCGASIEPDDPTFMGWIERRDAAPEMAQQHRASSPQQQARWYGQNGYWYDMVYHLTKLDRSQRL
ncbi:MAG: DUF928 domain-containing protein [Synechococcales cyanobacterium CRU_2_2]|nr:DUF928 domain-containing protein [Synechococcales cyanobacterium CRU_2_2]